MTTTLIQPLGDRVLVELAEEAAVTPSGILIARRDNKRTTEGVVVGVGANVASTIVRRTSRVLFDRHVGTEVTFDGRTYLILAVEHLLAVVVEGEPTGDNVVPFRRHDA